MITQIQGASSQSNVNLEKFNINLKTKNMSTNDTKSVQNVNLKSYQLSTTDYADFKSITDFFDLLSQNRRLIKINSVSLETNKDQDQENPVNPEFVKYNLTTNIYYWQEPYEKY